MKIQTETRPSAVVNWAEHKQSASQRDIFAMVGIKVKSLASILFATVALPVCVQGLSSLGCFKDRRTAFQTGLVG
jgi:hypothetical protein